MSLLTNNVLFPRIWTRGPNKNIKKKRVKEKSSHASTTPMLTVASHWKGIQQSLPTSHIVFCSAQFSCSHRFTFCPFAECWRAIRSLLRMGTASLNRNLSEEAPVLPPGFTIDNPTVNIFILFLLNYFQELPEQFVPHRFSWASLYFISLRFPQTTAWLLSPTKYFKHGLLNGRPERVRMERRCIKKPSFSTRAPNLLQRSKKALHF